MAEKPPRPAFGLRTVQRLLIAARRGPWPLDDMRLARWFLDAEIARMEAATQPKPPSRLRLGLCYLLFYMTRPPR